MSNFNDIKQEWAARNIPSAPENDYKGIIEKSKRIHTKQLIGQVVLGVTVLILILFFFYISAYKNATVFLGLGMMIGSLVLRIGIEFLSMIKKTHIAADKDMKAFNRELITYYTRRKVIHYLITPLLFGCYVAGFIMLLPSFKESLSAGFYTYIIVSSVFIFIGLAVLIGVQIRKELGVLRELHLDFAR